MRKAGIILAAGSSQRMGEPKVNLPLIDGITMGAVVLQRAIASELDFIVVVVRPDDPLTWVSTAEEQKVYMSVCHEARGGMSYSLREGISSVKEKGADCAMILLADQPLIQQAHINQLIACFKSSPDLDYVAAKDHDELKPPILFSRTMFNFLMQLKGDEGARKLLRSSSFQGIGISFESDMFLDADTKEELAVIKQKLSQESKLVHSHSDDLYQDQDT